MNYRNHSTYPTTTTITYDVTPEQKKNLELSEKAYMLGTLALNEPEYLYYGGEERLPVTFMKNSDSVLFFIKPLSENPAPIQDYYSQDFEGTLLYRGIDNRQSSAIISDPSYQRNISSRPAFWEEKLAHKLVLFKPKIHYGNHSPRPFLNLEIVSIEGDLDPALEDNPIICFPKCHLSTEQFEADLLAQNYITFDDYHHFYADPDYVVCGDYLYYNFQGWSKHPTDSNRWRINRAPEQIMKAPLTLGGDKFDMHKVNETANLIFIIEYAEMLFDDMLELHGINVFEHYRASATAPKVSTPVTPLSQVNTPTSSIATHRSVEPKSWSFTPSTATSEEVKFLHYLESVAQQLDLTYRRSDLVNFHVSVKTNALTLLAGMAGTGKSQLARVYAKALGLTEENGHLLFLPVSPSFLEPADILGFLNQTTGLYVPAETGLVDLLLKAEQHPDEFFMVIFDEMNLSQVEHWFAPFLSLLELNPNERHLKLYSEGSICHNGVKYKDSVRLGDNLIFVGTANLDETTKDFSDRLLDRVNVVSLQKPRFSEMVHMTSTNVSPMVIGYQDMSRWINHESGLTAFQPQELAFFDDLHDLIHRYDAQKGVSHRFVSRLGHYLNNLPMSSTGDYTLSRAEALDLGIKQRLLTKIKGSERHIGALVGTTTHPSIEPERSELLAFFQGDLAQSISPFKETQQELRRKALELGIHGYTN